MSTPIVGRNLRVEIATAFGSPIAIDAVSKANPGVVTENAHGLANGAVGFFSVVDGMVEINEQAIAVANTATNTFDLVGLNTTNFSTWVAGASQTLTMGSTWALLPEATGFTVGGGAAEQLADNRLHLSKNVNVSGYLAAQDLQLEVRSVTTGSAGLKFLEAKAQDNLPVLVRVLYNNALVRVAYGVPSLPGESISAGQLGSGQLSITTKGFVLKTA